MSEVAQVQVEVEAPEKMVDCTQEAQVAPAVAEAVPVVHKPPASKSRKRAAASQTSGLEAMAAKIKRLREEADEGEAAITAEMKKIEDLANDLQAKIALMRSEVDAKRAAAQRCSQEYLKKQCAASIAELEASIPKRPLCPFFMRDASKQKGEAWAKLSADEQQKYKDRHEKALKQFKEWGISEEGLRILSERRALISQCKATGSEELGRAIDANEIDGASNVSPAKCAKELVETPMKERPAKQRRVAVDQVMVSPKEPYLDESVLEEAGKADLLAQLRNLAARPDVLALGKSPHQLLHALKSHSGMVNAAKRALLST